MLGLEERLDRIETLLAEIDAKINVTVHESQQANRVATRLECFLGVLELLDGLLTKKNALLADEPDPGQYISS